MKLALQEHYAYTVTLSWLKGHDVGEDTAVAVAVAVAEHAN